MGAAIEAIREMEKQSPDDHPTSKRTLLIITDGEDNRSKHNREELQKLVKQKLDLKNKYNITFLGTNIDAIEMASQYGITEESTIDFDGECMKQAVQCASD